MPVPTVIYAVRGCPAMDSPKQLKETPRAAQAFQDYVAIGPARSLSRLIELYHDTHQSATKPPPTKRLDTLKEWSTKYGWQDRIAQAVTERGMQLLAQAAELDVETFLATSREYHRRLTALDIETMPLPHLHDVRSQVRRKDPTDGQTINVVIVQEAQRLAAELGISADDILAGAELIAKNAWDSR